MLLLVVYFSCLLSSALLFLLEKCQSAVSELISTLLPFQKHDLMTHVAHQCITMQYILDISKQLDVDPRACVPSFYTKIQVAETEYKDSFNDDLKSFIGRIEKRAQEKLEAAIKEVEEEERKERLGPGGLDPLEVLESLPKVIIFSHSVILSKKKIP